MQFFDQLHACFSACFRFGSFIWISIRNFLLLDRTSAIRPKRRLLACSTLLTSLVSRLDNSGFQCLKANRTKEPYLLYFLRKFGTPFSVFHKFWHFRFCHCRTSRFGQWKKRCLLHNGWVLCSPDKIPVFAYPPDG